MKKILIIFLEIIVIATLWIAKSYTNASMGLADEVQKQQQQSQQQKSQKQQTQTTKKSSTKSTTKSQTQSSEQDEPDTDTSASGVKEAAEDFIKEGQREDILPINKVISDLFPVGRTIEAIAILVLLVTGMILGLKYMISGTDERAKMKERLIWYIIAAVMVFGATGIYNLIASIVNSVGI